MYKHRNINVCGTKFLKEFINKYYINCMPKEKDKLNEKYIENDIEKFKKLLVAIPDEYVFKNNYKALKNNYKALNEAYNKILKEKENGFQDYYREQKEENKRNVEYRLNFYKMEIKSQYETKTRGLEIELEKQKAINEKWKAMFTEQAMANAKLINKEEN